MDSIDPELRGSEEERKPAEGPTTEASTEAYIYSDTQNGNDQISQQVSQSLAPEGMPYFSGPLEDLTATTGPTYQPLQFTTQEPRRRPRSCESCRGLKVKCEATGEGRCKRCAKAGRECLYTESNGRRKKKQDSKVAELEKKVSGLTAALLAQRGAEANDSLVFDESSIIHNEATHADAVNGKRTRSEFEEDYNSSPLHAAKRQELSVIVSSTQCHGFDSRLLNGLAKERITREFCASLKSLDSCFKRNSKVIQAEALKETEKPLANGQDTSEQAGKSDSPPELGATHKKNAPTASMGKTPLDLLSQVASNENPSSSSSPPGQNQWYSPYAKANQDTSTPYTQEKRDGNGSKDKTDAQDLEQLLRTEFGNRGDLVLNFLGSFFAGISDMGIKNGEE